VDTRSGILYRERTRRRRGGERLCFIGLGGYLDIACEPTLDQLVSTAAAEQGLELITAHGLVCRCGGDRFRRQGSPPGGGYVR